MRLIRILVAGAIVVLVPAAHRHRGPRDGHRPVHRHRNDRRHDLQRATQESVVIPRKGAVRWTGAVNTGRRHAQHRGQGVPQAPAAVRQDRDRQRQLGRALEPVHEHRRVPLRLPLGADRAQVRRCSGDHAEREGPVCTGTVTVTARRFEEQEPRPHRVARAHVLRDPQRRPRHASEAPMKGHPIRGFFAGLLLGICLDLDLASAAS